MFITWRLAGTLSGLPRQGHDGRAFVERDSILDRAKTGPLWPLRHDVARSVMSSILAVNGTRCQLHAFVITPNHVHVLLTPWVELATITRAIKGKSARQANLLLERTGRPFWQDESFDHWIRNPRQFDKIRKYIENNPVRAGLVDRPEHWPFSGANTG